MATATTENVTRENCFENSNFEKDKNCLEKAILAIFRGLWNWVADGRHCWPSCYKRVIYSARETGVLVRQLLADTE